MVFGPFAYGPDGLPSEPAGPHIPASKREKQRDGSRARRALFHVGRTVVTAALPAHGACPHSARAQEKELASLEEASSDVVGPVSALGRRR